MQFDVGGFELGLRQGFIFLGAEPLDLGFLSRNDGGGVSSLGFEAPPPLRRACASRGDVTSAAGDVNA